MTKSTSTAQADEPCRLAHGSAPDGANPAAERYNLRLYVAGQTARSVAAITNLRRICDAYLAGRYSVEVIDLIREPERATLDQILAIPTLVRSLPEPLKRIIGDLSNTERVLVGLDVRQTSALGERG